MRHHQFISHNVGKVQKALAAQKVHYVSFVALVNLATQFEFKHAGTQ